MKVVAKAFLSFTIILSLFSSASGRIIYIPSPSLATIQGGINYASNGDTVLVNSGTYYENINFKGKKIVVASWYLLDNDTSQINTTIIDATYKPSLPVASFKSGEDSLTILTGFTLQHSDNWWGILCDSGSSPKILFNRIKNNLGGLACSKSSNPQVGKNFVGSNTSTGILCEKGSSPLIEGNTLVQNGEKGIIAENLATNPVIRGNYVSGHQVGIEVYDGTPLVERNVITESSQRGIDIYNSSPQIFNNTVANNTGDGAGISNLSSANLRNNILANNSGAGIRVSTAQPVIQYNDVWGNTGGNFSGAPLGVGNMFWGKNIKGIPCDEFLNISQEPDFVNAPTDFSLQCASPCIDDGDPDFPVPDNGSWRIDMGAFEYPVTTGDIDYNGKINVSDVVDIINYCYKSGPAPDPMQIGDVNADGSVNVSDAIHLINYLYKYGMPPCH